MPRIVDHARRREDIARLVVQVIREEGVEKATMRRIATVGGFTIGVLAHYFKDKDQLITFAFDWIAQQSFTELDSAVAPAQPGLARLRIALDYMVPESNTGSFIAVWIGLWSRATQNLALARPHEEYYREWRRRLKCYLNEAKRAGEVAPDQPLDDTTDLLAAAIDGFWIAGTFEPRRFSRHRRRRLLNQLLSAVVAPRTDHD